MQIHRFNLEIDENLLIILHNEKYVILTEKLDYGNDK